MKDVKLILQEVKLVKDVSHVMMINLMNIVMMDVMMLFLLLKMGHVVLAKDEVA